LQGDAVLEDGAVDAMPKHQQQGVPLVLDQAPHAQGAGAIETGTRGAWDGAGREARIQQLHVHRGGPRPHRSGVQESGEAQGDEREP
jgi:hypothetical protein